MLSWPSRLDEVHLPDIKRISLPQALLVAVIAWCVHRVISHYIIYKVSLSILTLLTASIRPYFFSLPHIHISLCPYDTICHLISLAAQSIFAKIMNVFWPVLSF